MPIIAFYHDPPVHLFPYFFPWGIRNHMDASMIRWCVDRGHKNDLLLRKRTQMRSPTKQQRILRRRRRWERWWRSDGGFWPIFDKFTHCLGRWSNFDGCIFIKNGWFNHQPDEKLWEVNDAHWMLMGLKNLDQNNNVDMVQDYERISCSKSFLSNFMLIMWRDAHTWWPGV